MDALLVVALIGVSVPLAYERQNVRIAIGFEGLNGVGYARLVGSGEDGAEARLLQDGSKHAEEANLRLSIEVATFLRTALIPIVCQRFVEGFQRLELYAVSLFVVLAYVHEIVRELLVVFGPQVIFATIFIACHASAPSHVVGAGVAEGLEHGIGPLLAYLEQDFPLCRVALPMVLVAAEVLEALHLSPKSFALSHVVKRAMAVLRVFAATDVIAEMAVVQSVGTNQPLYNLVDFLIVPLAALCRPPAERHSPAVPMLTNLPSVNRIIGSLQGSR